MFCNYDVMFILVSIYPWHVDKWNETEIQITCHRRCVLTLELFEERGMRINVYNYAINYFSLLQGLALLALKQFIVIRLMVRSIILQVIFCGCYIFFGDLAEHCATQTGNDHKVNTTVRYRVNLIVKSVFTA